MAGMPTAVGGMPQPWLPSSWRDLADELSAAQADELAVRERAGWNPGMLLVTARDLAARNLDGWL